MGRALDETLAVLNGLVGDYLVRTDNALATGLGFYRAGEPVRVHGDDLDRAYPTRTARVVVLLHGVMCTEGIFRYRDGSGAGDYGAQLERDLGLTPFYVRYNTGRPIADNGAQLAALLSELVATYEPGVEELVLIGYSMGGLVVRSACHVAAEQSLPWLPRVTRAIYLGTPHLGAPSERLGRLVARTLGAIDDPYTRLIADIANLRSAGVKDLGDADLRHEDRSSQSERWSLRDARHPVPLLAAFPHYLIAGALSPGELAPALSTWFGDALVPVSSATMRGAALPPHHVKIFPGHSHVDIPRSAEVYAQLKTFCEARP